ERPRRSLSGRFQQRQARGDQEGRLPHDTRSVVLLSDVTGSVVACNREIGSVWLALRPDRCVGAACKGAYHCCAAPPCARAGGVAISRSFTTDFPVTG